MTGNGRTHSAHPPTDRIWTGSSQPGPLAGVRVVDFGQYIAGPMAAMLLADQGADVIRIEPPDGPAWRSPANAALLRGRRTVGLDLSEGTDRRRALSLVSTADVLIENFRPKVMDRMGLGPDEVCARNPALVYCSMPGFGRSDPRASVRATEGVVMAAAGGFASPDSPSMYADVPLPPCAEPQLSAIPLGSVFAALHSALSITAGLIARDRDGRGQWIEVPLHDALFEASGSRAMSFERSAPPFTSFGSGVYVCSDGRRVTFLANWFRHLVWFLEAADRTVWIEEGLVSYERLWNDPDACAELQHRLVALFATRPALEWERIARDHGCSIAMLRSTTEWLAEPATRDSAVAVRTADPEIGEVSVPGLGVTSERAQTTTPPRRTTATQAESERIISALDLMIATDGRDEPTRKAAESRDPDHRPPLAGIRVLEMSRVVAAPTAGRLLGELGADVLRIDIDPAKSHASFPEPLMHVQLNRGKRTAIVDLTVEEDRRSFARIVGDSDIVVQNFTLGTAERLRIDHESLRTIRPDVVSVYLNAFGTQGEWAPHRGFAEIANVASGLTDHVRGGSLPASGSSPIIDLPRWFYTDYAAGALSAFAAVAGLLQRTMTEEGDALSASLVGATALEQISWIVEASRGHAPTMSTAWGEVLRASDGWLYVESPRAGGDADTPARVDVQGVADLDVETAVRLLWRKDVAAHPILSMYDVMRREGPADRRGIRVEAVTEAHGRVVMAGPVTRFSRTPIRVGEPPRQFGADGMTPPFPDRFAPDRR